MYVEEVEPFYVSNMFKANHNRQQCTMNQNNSTKDRIWGKTWLSLLFHFPNKSILHHAVNK